VVTHGAEGLSPVLVVARGGGEELDQVAQGRRSTLWAHDRVGAGEGSCVCVMNEKRARTSRPSQRALVIARRHAQRR
jgi:microcompartment protein CcmK/EutM